MKLFIVLFMVLAVIFMLFTINKMKCPRFKSEKIGILFAVSTNDSHILGISHNLEMKIKNILDDYTLTGLFDIKKCPPNLIPINHDAAMRLRDKCSANLIIWGEFESGKIQGKKTYGFKKIHFTYKMPTVTKKEFLSISPIMGIGALGKKIIIQEEESFRDVDIVAQNISEIALYIVGISLYLLREFDKCLRIFIPLLPKIKIKYPNSDNVPPIVKDIVNVVNKTIKGCYYEMARTHYNNNVFPDIKMGNAINLDEVEKCLMLIEEAKKYYKEADIYNMSAIVYFLKGNIKKAQGELSMASNYASREDPQPDLNMAFLEIYNGNLNKGKRQYDRAFIKVIPQQQLDEIKKFIEGLIKIEKDNYNLHFALGYLYEKLGENKSLSIKEYEKYINAAKVKNVNGIIYYVEKRIKKLNSSE